MKALLGVTILAASILGGCSAADEGKSPEQEEVHIPDGVADQAAAELQDVSAVPDGPQILDCAGTSRIDDYSSPAPRVMPWTIVLKVHPGQPSPVSMITEYSEIPLCQRDCTFMGGYKSFHMRSGFAGARNVTGGYGSEISTMEILFRDGQITIEALHQKVTPSAIVGFENNVSGTCSMRPGSNGHRAAPPEQTAEEAARIAEAVAAEAQEAVAALEASTDANVSALDRELAARGMDPGHTALGPRDVSVARNSLAGIAQAYPARAVQQGLQGRVGIEAVVAPNGRAISCSVHKTSGHAILDDAACEGVKRRGRFEPALDDNGLPVEARFRTEVQYKLYTD